MPSWFLRSGGDPAGRGGELVRRPRVRLPLERRGPGLSSLPPHPPLPMFTPHPRGTGFFLNHGFIHLIFFRASPRPCPTPTLRWGEGGGLFFLSPKLGLQKNWPVLPAQAFLTPHSTPSGRPSFFYSLVFMLLCVSPQRVSIPADVQPPPYN